MADATPDPAATTRLLRQVGDGDRDAACGPQVAEQLPPPLPGTTWFLRAQSLAADKQPEEAKAAAKKAVALLTPVLKANDPLLDEANKLAGDGDE